MATTYIPKLVYNAITITFDYPTMGPDAIGETIMANRTVNISGSGEQQTLLHHMEIENNYTFSHISSTLKSSIDTFLKDWGFLGNEFDYYPDKDDATTKITVRLSKRTNSVKYKILTWTGTANANPIYELTMRFRRVTT